MAARLMRREVSAALTAEATAASALVYPDYEAPVIVPLVGGTRVGSKATINWSAGDALVGDGLDEHAPRAV